jgi:hypothetical protein
MSIETIGVSHQHVTIQVSLSEMRDWDATRITEFFQGIARTVAAVNPNNWDMIVYRAKPKDDLVKST